MIRQASIAVTTLLASGTAIAVLVSPVGAAASGAHHTLHVTAKRAAEVRYKKTGGFTEADKLRSKSGKALGTAVSDCTPVSSAKADCSGVFGLDGGLLDGRFSLNFSTGAIQGAITGGTMAYRHATGTITGSGFNGGAHLTVRYH